MALPTFPTVEQIEPGMLVMLRYIYDALTGGAGGGGAATGVGTYNKCVGTKKSNGGAHTVSANTAHMVIIVATGAPGTYNFGGSVNLDAPINTPIYLKASTLHTVDINITSGGTGSISITEIQPQ